MANKNQTFAWKPLAALNGIPVNQVFTVKYGFPPELNEEQLEVLKILVLNRIDSIVTGQSFNRDTAALVLAHITPSQWDLEHGGVDTFYRREASIIDEMFSDVEDDPAYRSTLGDLSRCRPSNFKVQLITENRIYLELQF